MNWNVSLGAENPKKRLIAAIAVIVVATVGLVFLQNIALALVGLIAVFASTAELFLPVSYWMTHQKVGTKCGLSSTEILWENVKTVWEDSDGIKLSPLDKGHRMEAFRGVYLRYANNRDAVLAKIAEHWNGDPILLGRGIEPAGD